MVYSEPLDGDVADFPDDPKPIDRLIAFAISCAGSGSGPRSLGRTQIVKYVYLGDLAYAERHGGRPYSGVAWRFLHLGPWAHEVQDRIEPVALAIGAHEFEWRSEDAVLDESFTRWAGGGVELGPNWELPLVSEHAIKRAVKEFGGDTNALLHYVYLTAPMLNAKPGSYLEFPEVPKRALDSGDSSAEARPSSGSRRDKQLRTRVEAALRDARAQRATSPRKRLRVEPRYDELFARTTQWLDEMAGVRAPESGEAIFDDTVWDSEVRRGGKLP